MLIKHIYMPAGFIMWEEGITLLSLSSL